VAILLACTSNNRATLPDADFFVQEGQTFVLRVGDTAGIQTQASIAIVRFGAILEDTRCPANDTCDEPGHATLSLSVQLALNVSDAQVQVPPDGGAEVQVEELKIEVLELRPAAETGVDVDLLSYQAAMRVVQTEDLLP